MGKYDKMSNDDFREHLLEIMEEQGMEAVLMVPGVYEAVSEHFNNDVLERWEERNPDEVGADEETDANEEEDS
jgi:hypothetical protein